MYKEINLPQSLKIDVKSYKKVVRLESFTNIVSFKSKLDKTIDFYSKNTKILEFYLDDISLLKTLNNLRYHKNNIMFTLNDKNVKLLKEYKDILKNFNLTAILDSIIKPSEIVMILEFLNSHGIKSELTFDLFKNISAKQMEVITKKIVLNPSFVKNIEPFFSFTNYIFNKKVKKSIDFSLWDIFKEQLDNNSYITKDGYVTISKRWDRKSRYLFNLDEPTKQYESELFKEIDSYEQNLFFKNLDCAMCESYEVCKAYLKFEDSRYDCNSFKKLLKDVENNFDIFKVKKVA